MSDCSPASGCSSPASSPTPRSPSQWRSSPRSRARTVVLTGFGRLSLVERIAKRLPEPPPVIELDVTEHRAPRRAWPTGYASTSTASTGSLHSIGFAPQSCLGGGFLDAPWEDVATALHVSTYSLQVAGDGGAAADEDAAASVVGLDLRRQPGLAGLRLDGRGQGRAWSPLPLPRPLPRPAGHPSQPGRRRAAAHHGRQVDPRLRAVRGRLDRSAPRWAGTSPTEPAARACVALLSDWFPATTGEIVHVDGGYHAIGA